MLFKNLLRGHNEGGYMGFEIPQSLPGTDITIGTGEKKTFRSNAKKEE